MVVLPKSSIGVGEGKAGVSGECVMEEGQGEHKERENSRAMVCGLSQFITCLEQADCTAWASQPVNVLVRNPNWAGIRIGKASKLGRHPNWVHCVLRFSVYKVT